MYISCDGRVGERLRCGPGDPFAKGRYRAPCTAQRPLRYGLCQHCACIRRGEATTAATRSA